MDKNPYELADITADLLRKQAIRRFQNARVKANTLNFDELDVIRVCTDLYDNLDNDNKKKFLELAQLTYGRTEPRGQEEPDWSWLLALLDAYNPITKYVYSHEVERKKAYLQEAVISVADQKKGYKDLVGMTKESMFRKGRWKSKVTNAQKSTIKKEFDKSLRYWARMTDQYCIDVSDSAQMKAYKDAGIEKVRWNAELDGRECKICRDRDGKVYPIDSVPAKPHWACRCWFTPA